METEDVLKVQTRATTLKCMDKNPTDVNDFQPILLFITQDWFSQHGKEEERTL